MCNGMIISNILYRYISEVGFTHLNLLKGNASHFKDSCILSPISHISVIVLVKNSNDFSVIN